jgi:hypothetical protein
MRLDDISISVIVAIAKIVDEPLIFNRELRVAQREEAHQFRVRCGLTRSRQPKKTENKASSVQSLVRICEERLADHRWSSI